MQTLVGADGKEIRQEPPHGDELPPKGFDQGACPEGSQFGCVPNFKTVSVAAATAATCYSAAAQQAPLKVAGSCTI